MSRATNRREFLKDTAFAGAALVAAGSRGALAGESPNDKLNLGIIGAGGRGASNTGKMAGENVVALCDVDDNNLTKAAEKFPKASKHHDWRKLLEQKDIDAVVISTPDHHHALAGVAALKLGLHVFCEKPLAHSVHEARAMQEAYHNAPVATQMGTQIHATGNYRRVVELIQSKAIGNVHEVHAWCGRKGRESGERPSSSPPVPDHLNWDLWLGPAPYRPFHPGYLPGCTKWEQWWDFGNGCLGDMGSHVIDLPYWALDLRRPTTVEAEGSQLRPECYPEWLIARWEHPAGAGRPTVKLTWYDGIQRPESPPGHDLNDWNLGVLFVGDNGMLLADYGRHRLLPEEDFKDFQRPEPWIPPSRGHYKEWLHACKTGAPTTCNFDYSGMLIEHNLLGTVAFRTGKKLQWDPVKVKATNCPEADQYIRREYRDGWTL